MWIHDEKLLKTNFDNVTASSIVGLDPQKNAALPRRRALGARRAAAGSASGY
jgi:hypothetical protein